MSDEHGDLINSDQSRSPVPQRECPNCGQVLNPKYYFCPRCARSYKSPEETLPAIAPEYKSEHTQIQEDSPQVFHLFWAYLGTLIGGAILGLMIFQDPRAYLGEIIGIETALMTVTTLIFTVAYWSSLKRQLDVTLLWNKWVPLSFLLLIPIFLVHYGYFSFLFEFSSASRSMTQMLKDRGTAPWVLILLICVQPAIFEEIAFRGLIQHWLKVSVGPTKAIVIGAGLFAAMHLSAVSFPYLFLVGLFFGWIKWKTGSLYPCMLLHFTHNFVVIYYFHP